MQKSTTADLSAKVKILAAAAALAAGAMIAFSGPGHAADDDEPTKPTSCPSGYVWSSSKGKCVKINSSVDDEELYEQGRALANAGQYEKADQDWIKANWTATETFPDVPVSVLRARVELRRLMMAYFKQTKRKKLEEFDVVKWQPQWVDDQWTAWKNTN